MNDCELPDVCAGNRIWVISNVLLTTDPTLHSFSFLFPINKPEYSQCCPLSAWVWDCPLGCG